MYINGFGMDLLHSFERKQHLRQKNAYVKLIICMILSKRQGNAVTCNCFPGATVYVFMVYSGCLLQKAISQ